MSKKKKQKPKKKQPKKALSLCTDDGKEFARIKSRAIKLAYKAQATGRFCKAAIAQFIADAEFTTDYRAAVLHTFHVPFKSLTKQERKIAKFAYSIAESNYLSRLHKMVITDDKAHAALKVVAEIKGMIRKEAPVIPVSPNAGLKITVTDEAGNEIPAKYRDKTVKKVEPEPLVLDAKQSADVTTH